LGLFLVSGLGVGKGIANTSSSQIVLEKVAVKIHNLPAEFEGLKIALLSDLHSSPIVHQDHLIQAARLAQGEKPDIVALTGDFIGHTLRNSPKEIHQFEGIYLDHLVEALSLLKPAIGTFGVLGNHDFWSGPEVTRLLVQRFEADLDVQWLRNRSLSLKKGASGITLLGVDDYWQRSFSLQRALRGVNPENVNILLSHNPEVNHRIRPEDGIDLVLSGHTHGGQITFPLIGVPFHPGIRSQKYIRGLVQDGYRQTYITRGVGHLIVPIRFNCPPEVTLLTLTSDSSGDQMAGTTHKS